MNVLGTAIRIISSWVRHSGKMKRVRLISNWVLFSINPDHVGYSGVMESKTSAVPVKVLKLLQNVRNRQSSNVKNYEYATITFHRCKYTACLFVCLLNYFSWNEKRQRNDFQCA